MQTNVLEYIENTAGKYPEKVAFADDEAEVTFGQFHDAIRRVGSRLIHDGFYHEPVIVFMNKSPDELMAFFGVVESGCFYVPVDEEMPSERINLIIKNSGARLIISDQANYENAKGRGNDCEVALFRDLLDGEADDESLAEVRRKAIDVDPVYILFTSGSTGVPKGVTGTHRGVIDYIDALANLLKTDQNTVFGNQAPLHFDASMKEIYLTMKCGCTTQLIQQEMFVNPIKLVNYLNDHQINTLCWVVSALTLISAFKTFDTVKPEFLKTIAFVGEVFPIKQFNIWKRTFPEVRFFNLYGPTEITGVCCAYPVTREFEEGEAIPVGKPFPNTRIFLLKKDGTLAAEGEEGEICVSGTCVTAGYYNDPERSAPVFVQNPLNHSYREIIYRTGDIGKLDADGNLVFMSRKDHQIKHMGHRIELGEIEADASLIEGLRQVCCIYSKEDEKIVLFYSGDLSKAALLGELKKRLQRYMIPNSIMQLDLLPKTPSGKLDRKAMERMYEEKKNSRKRRK